MNNRHIFNDNYGPFARHTSNFGGVNKTLLFSPESAAISRTIKIMNQNYTLGNSIQCRKLKPELKVKQGLAPVS